MPRTLVLLLFVGCYNPNLGAHPFLCGPPPERACPDGYRCDISTNVCRMGSTGATVDAPIIPHDGGDESDAGHGGITCAVGSRPDEDLEPNDTEQQADQGPSHLGSNILCHPQPSGPCDPFGSYTHFEICPRGDVDYYGMDLHAGDHIHVDVLFHVIVGDLDAAVIDPAGRFLVISATAGDNESFDFVAATAGRYYLLVEGFMNQTNTYDLSFTKM
jgi:hypothetical protein